MKSKKTHFNILSVWLIFLFITSPSLQAQDDNLKQAILKRGEVTKTSYFAIFKEGQFLFTGFAGTGSMAEIAIDRARKLIIRLSPTDLGKFKVLKKTGKGFAYLDIATTGAKIYESLENKDLVAATEHLVNHAASGGAVKVGVFIAAGLGASNPVVLLVAGVGSACAYGECIQPMLHDYIFDPLRNKNERTPYVETDEDKKNTKEWRIKECVEEISQYRNTKKRPPSFMYKICKQYGIDIYDLCPNNQKELPGVCGCEKPDIDTDGDGVYDCHDKCKDNPKLTKKSGYGKDGCQSKEDWREEQLEKTRCPENSYPAWNNNKNMPKCYCIRGMEPDESGTCVNKEDTYTPHSFTTCKEKGGVSIFEGGRRYCACVKPLEWSPDKTKCIDPALANIDCSQWPGSIPSYDNDKKPGCTCAFPLVKNKEKNACITEKEAELEKIDCSQWQGSKPAYDDYGKPRCVCEPPLIINKEKNACITQDDSWIGNWSVNGNTILKGKKIDINGILEIRNNNRELFMSWATINKKGKKNVIKFPIVIEDGVIKVNTEVLFQKKPNTNNGPSKDLLGLNKIASLLKDILISLRISRNENICTIQIKVENKNHSFYVNCERL